MFKNLNVSFAPKCLVMVPRSRWFCKLILLHTNQHTSMTITCLCRLTVLVFVL